MVDCHGATLAKGKRTSAKVTRRAQRKHQQRSPREKPRQHNLAQVSARNGKVRRVMGINCKHAIRGYGGTRSQCLHSTAHQHLYLLKIASYGAPERLESERCCRERSCRGRCWTHAQFNLHGACAGRRPGNTRALKTDAGECSYQRHLLRRLVQQRLAMQLL